MMCVKWVELISEMHASVFPDKFFGGGASELRASDFPDPPFNEIGGGAYFDWAPSI